MKLPKIIKKHKERLIAYPKNTKEVSNIVKFSNKNELNIIPLGGETNRVDGTKAVQKYRNLFISFSKMNKILEIDTDSLILTVESGVTLKKFTKHHNPKIYFFQ
tara:strand:- start:1 stop:312 length:312 start_codon:yes stop_codon:yes gene_type:complete